MEGSKIQLSPTELQLAMNADVILTKNSILQKIILLFGELSDEMSRHHQHQWWTTTPPKISRGEQYRGLPYVVLDYPRISNDEGMLFIRTMFWWGNFFSSTLHVSSNYAETYLARLADEYEVFRQKHFYLGIQDDPWQHHFEEDNYLPVMAMSYPSFLEGLEQRSHIKIAARWPLHQWTGAANALWKNWYFLSGLVS